MAIGAEDQGTVAQRDTYFAVPNGALKLREEQPGDSQLIQYVRAEAPQQRESRYRIAKVSDPAAVTAVLAASLGIHAIVGKRRHLLTWNEVRIHLDAVEHLGTFIELEAVAPPGSDLQREHELVAELREALEITDDRLIARGYAAQLPPQTLSATYAPADRKL